MNNSAYKPYWASVDAKEIADNILEKVDKFYKYMAQSGRLDLYRRSWLYYFRPRITGGMLTPVGQQGELTALSVNHYRNLLSHLQVMTTQQRISFEPKATNSDVKSQAQVILSSGLLDYYMREKKLERNIKQAVDDGLRFGEAFVRAEWDANAGQSYGVTASGDPQYGGDLKYSNYGPMDVARDFTLSSPREEVYYIPRNFRNKYELAAKYPDLADKILDDTLDPLEVARTTMLNYLAMDDSDNIAVYTLIHKPTPQMPTGRYTEVLENGTVLIDGPLPYDETHMYRLAPDEESGTIFGYTVAFDLLPVQEALDILYSTAISNNATFGVQNILVPKGHDLSTSQMSGGMNVMEFDPKVGEPKALQLVATAPETYNFMTMLEQLQETLSGVNSVARGNPEASLKSGAALALVQSMAIQFNMGLQQSYINLNEDLGTGSINILKTYAATPRVSQLSGKSNRPLMREWTGNDLGAINRVTVGVGNPLMNTTAGKLNLAETYMDRGMIENPDQFIQVVNTGRLEPIIEGKQANLLLTKGENEQLSEGVPQRALITDNHAKHILEHSTVLANPEIRQDPNNPIVQVTLAHIQEHINFANSPGYQMMAAMLGHQVMVPPAPPPMEGGTGQMLDGTNPVVQEAQAVEQPNMPSPPQGTDPQSAEVIEGMGA